MSEKKHRRGMTRLDLDFWHCTNHVDVDELGEVVRVQSPAIPVEIAPEVTELTSVVETPQTITATPTDEAIAATRESESKSPESSEILTSGEAMGRMVYIKNRNGEISRESWTITKWCEGNGFYTLENGEFFYPCELVLTT